ncbi:uncharacterized protein E0L32_007321 [Thyridium curvatum]|uniref:Histidinol-phosphatase n=1 Tax=Thyridium curvatum TaxID=1093900 RepID=A0A507B593_9PEZI|nr:uncharacterized protein E0L32_007321 [Thyridium curvatum]TPX12018.1 hypothetical protein E0L32_007321 [Thyridium curvatum]
MHSHSGQFCPGHAKDQLEDIVLHAISIGYKTIGLTEHMPRLALCDLYPEEMDDPEASLAVLPPRHEAYLAEARRLQEKYAGQGIALLVGFEGEFIRGPEYAGYVRRLAADPRVDYFIGSLHHTCGVPIDFDAEHYARAATAAAIAASSSSSSSGSSGSSGSEFEDAEDALAARYYDEQHEMLAALRPRVVGHFDLVRLLSADPARDPRRAGGGRVWDRVRRNLELVAGYGGWLECNTSALRKGLAEPYPARPVAEEWLRLGGRFTFSDDSHGIAQVGTNYARGLDYLASLGVEEVWTFERKAGSRVGGGGDGSSQKAELVPVSVSLSAFRESLKLP